MNPVFDRTLAAFATAVAGIALMLALGHSPAHANQKPELAQVAKAELVPTVSTPACPAVRPRPLRVSLPDFLNLGAPRRARTEV